MADRVLLPAVEHEVEAPSHVLDKWQDRLSLDLGSLPTCYGWIFPKEDHFNVGVGGSGGQKDFGRRLKIYDSQHLDRRMPDRVRVRKTFGFTLPLRKKAAPIQKGHALLVGDAAGLVEALTGEGIYYAIRSGQIAAEAIARNAHAEYQMNIDRELMPSLLLARQYAALYRKAPGLWYLFGVYSRSAWSALCMTIRGERQMHQVRQQIGVLSKIAEFFQVSA